jgi:hypothetical protein
MSKGPVSLGPLSGSTISTFEDVNFIRKLLARGSGRAHSRLQLGSQSHAAQGRGLRSFLGSLASALYLCRREDGSGGCVMNIAFIAFCLLTLAATLATCVSEYIHYRNRKTPR